jgi:AMMECR1 domain-containing protein
MKIWLLALLLLSAPAFGALDTFAAFSASASDRGLRDEIVAIARKAVVVTVRDGVVALPPTPRHPLLRRPVGVFVTLVEDGRVRGCMGAMEPVESSAAADIVRAAVLAATEDRRYPPILPSELGRIAPVVSIVGPRKPVRSLAQLDPLHLGLLVERDGRGGVLLPGEALSPGYQLAGCKAKAGIAAKARVAMYTFPTVVFGSAPSRGRQP